MEKDSPSSVNVSEQPSPAEVEAIVRVGAHPHFIGGSYNSMTRKITPGVDGEPGKLPDLDAHTLASERTLPTHLKDVRNPAHKPALFAGFARGLEALHSKGFLHRGIDLAHLGIYAEPSGDFRGVLLSAPTISAVGPPTNRTGGGFSNSNVRVNPSIATHVPRTHSVFRAPETYYLRTALDVAADSQTRNLSDTPATSDATPRYYAHGEKADVWSLGVALAHMITGAPLFNLIGVPPHTSMRGAERIEDMIARGGSTESVERAIATEASRWQAFRLFGDASKPNDEYGDTCRWVNTKALVGSGIRKGLIEEKQLSHMSDLLFKMLSPNPEKRANLTEILAHPAILSSGSPSPSQVPTLYSHDSASTKGQCYPLDGWTMDKDAAVTHTIRVFARSKETSHLPAEALFVIYDAIARIAGGFHSGEPSSVLRAVVVATARLCGTLYDQTFDLKGQVSVAACGGSEELAEVSVQFEPYVHHFFGGKLRRNGYLFDKVHAYPRISERIVGHFVGASKKDALFRASYLTLDVPMFITEATSVSTTPETTTLGTHESIGHLVASYENGRV
jgi:hypothetical protein